MPLRPVATPAESASRTSWRMLSYNIQGGLHTAAYHHYLTGAWRHALPARGRMATLATMAQLMRGFDFVGVQEADAGSFRTGRRNLVAELAHHAGFAHSGSSITRNLGPLARICLGFLSQQEPLFVNAHRLPSRIPGRGALELRFAWDKAAPLTVVVAHLSLTPTAQSQQLHALAEMLRGRPRSVVLGDFNCGPERLRTHAGLKAAGLRLADDTPATHPSWAPARAIDHVLVSADLQVQAVRALPQVLSDHCPLAFEIRPAAAAPGTPAAAAQSG